jgi:heme/copper-type cytochrome/quinol oxidase subunit 2
MDYSPILVIVLVSLIIVLCVVIFVWRLKTGKAHHNNFSADRATNPKEYWVIQALIAVPALGLIGFVVWFARLINSN